MKPPRGVKRRALSALSSILIVCGVLLMVDAGLTVAWQEPLTAAYASWQQRGLRSDLKELEREPLGAAERRALAKLEGDRRRMAFLARALDRRVADGKPVGRIEIPRIDASDVIVAGTGPDQLRKGPGHYPSTPLPGVPGTVGVAGHRTTYGAPFRKLDKLRRGDRVTVVMPYGRFTYTVERRRIVPPTAIWVTQRVGYDRLVLSACHPLYSAAQRIVVFARLVRSEPRGAAA